MQEEEIQILNRDIRNLIKIVQIQDIKIRIMDEYLTKTHDDFKKYYDLVLRNQTSNSRALIYGARMENSANATLASEMND